MNLMIMMRMFTGAFHLWNMIIFMNFIIVTVFVVMVKVFDFTFSLWVVTDTDH